MKLAILGHGSVTKALLPLLTLDARFQIAGIHTRSHPAAASVEEFLDRAQADTLVELTTLNPDTGEPAITHVRAAFARGMHVVTANKGPIAFRFHELAGEAQERAVTFRFESAVMDGAPVFNQFRNNMPGVKVLGFTGVLNSTSNLVIETMEQGGSFEDGIAVARGLGITEADPSYDIDGWDSACKTAALANVLMDARTTPHQVHREGIRNVKPEHLRELMDSGQTIRLVSRAHESLSVHPEVLRRTDLLACGRGTTNILLFDTDRMGVFGTVSIAPLVEQTAYGVYIDLVSLLEAPSRS